MPSGGRNPRRTAAPADQDTITLSEAAKLFKLASLLQKSNTTDIHTLASAFGSNSDRLLEPSEPSTSTSNPANSTKTVGTPATNTDVPNTDERWFFTNLAASANTTPTTTPATPASTSAAVNQVPPAPAVQDLQVMVCPVKAKYDDQEQVVGYDIGVYTVHIIDANDA